MEQIDFRNDILPLKDSLFRLALRITLNKAEAEDVVQETMIKVWNRRNNCENIDSIEAFCFTVCRNLALDKTKAKANQGEPLDGAELQASANATPEEQTERNDKVELVKDIINNLPEKQRTAIQLREFEEKSYKEIADVMGISEEQVKINIFRARQTIRKKYLEKENYGL